MPLRHAADNAHSLLIERRFHSAEHTDVADAAVSIYHEGERHSSLNMIAVCLGGVLAGIVYIFYQHGVAAGEGGLFADVVVFIDLAIGSVTTLFVGLALYASSLSETASAAKESGAEKHDGVFR